MAPFSRNHRLVLALAAAALAARAARACDAQRENPVFVDAKAEIAALSPQARAQVAAEWAELETEQRSLWQLAGQIDEACRQGEVSPEYLSYAERVLAWEERLSKFLRRMHTPLASPSAPPEPEPAAAAVAPGQGPREIEFPGRARPKPAPKSAPRPPPVPAPVPAAEPSLLPVTPPALL